MRTTAAPNCGLAPIASRHVGIHEYLFRVRDSVKPRVSHSKFLMLPRLCWLVRFQAETLTVDIRPMKTPPLRRS